MARETRSLRPFEVLDETQRLMRDGVQVTSIDPEKRAAFDSQCLTLSFDQYVSEKIVLWFFRHKEESHLFWKTVINEVDGLYPDTPGVVHLVVSISNKRLRMTDVIYDQPVLAGDKPLLSLQLDSLSVGKGRPRQLQTPKDGCEVLVEFLLGRNLTPKERRPGMAWRKGSWLARSRIRVAGSSDLTGPTPLALSSATREQLSIPPNAVHFCRLLKTGSALLAAETFDDALEFYVDEGLLDSILVDPGAVLAQRHQIDWILEVAKVLIMATTSTPDFADFDPGIEPWSGSILRAILDKVVDPKGEGPISNIQDALNLLEGEPNLFLSHLQDRARLLDLERALLADDMRTEK
jgi:hypothetical protein